VKQVFFMTLSAMFIAFSLSWATPSHLGEKTLVVPDSIMIVSSSFETHEPEMYANLALIEACENIGHIEKEFRDHKLIFSLRLTEENGALCSSQKRTKISLRIPLDELITNRTQTFEVYFRIDDEGLRYYGFFNVTEGLLIPNENHILQSAME